MIATVSPALADVLQHAAAAWQLFRAGRSLDRALVTALESRYALRPAVQDTLYTAVRYLAASERIVERLAARRPSSEAAALLAVALGQLQANRHAEHVVVDQTVCAAQASPPVRAAAGFINAVLRNFLRSRESLLAELQRDPAVRHNLPHWWLDRLQRHYPDQWLSVAQAQQQLPPLVLRVNTTRTNAQSYIARLAKLDIAASRVGAQAIWLHQPLPVHEIPGFTEGDVSVQDAGAQLAAQWLDATPGMRVLDACAAPGGKTTHLAELGVSDLLAVEADRERVARIRDNLQRTGLSARIVVGDATQPNSWASKDARFDRILLDAPCTASGIVRRHPDIPWLRRPDDVAQLTTLQGELLDALWPLLSVGGRLLYVVCSLFPEEGREQIARFGERHCTVRQLPLPAAELLPTPVTPAASALAWHGSPLPTLHDGFFYALLEKTG